MFRFWKKRKKRKYNWELDLIAGEISRSKRYGLSFGILAVKVSHSAPRGLSKLMPGRTLSFDVLNENIRYYDRVIDSVSRRYHIILPQTDKDGVKAVKERIHKLAREHKWGEVSFGSAVYPGDGEDPQTLLNKAMGERYF
jgi:hypothetical protein